MDEDVRARLRLLRAAWLQGGAPPRVSKTASPRRNQQFVETSNAHGGAAQPGISYHWKTVPRSKSKLETLVKDTATTWVEPLKHSLDEQRPTIAIAEAALPLIRRSDHPLGSHSPRSADEAARSSSQHPIEDSLEGLDLGDGKGEQRAAGLGLNASLPAVVRPPQKRASWDLDTERVQQNLARRKGVLQEMDDEFAAIHKKLQHKSAATHQWTGPADEAAPTSPASPAEAKFQLTVESLFRRAIDVHTFTNDLLGEEYPDSDKVKACIHELELALPDASCAGSSRRRRQQPRTKRPELRIPPPAANCMDASRLESTSKEACVNTSGWVLVPRVGLRLDYSVLRQLVKSIESNCNLTHLSMPGCRITAAGLALLTPALAAATRLTVLNLTFNELREDGALSLSACLPSLAELRVLSLHGNFLGDGGLRHLAVTFQNSRLEELGLGGNQISSESQDSLRAIVRTAVGLTSLDLSRNVLHYSFRDSKGPEFAAALVKALTGVTALTALDLSSNCLFHHGARHLAQYLYGVKHLGALRVLNLGGERGGGNRIGSLGMKSLSSALYWNPLVDVDLSYNELGLEGAQSLSIALCVNTSVTRLSLRGNHMGAAGVVSVCGLFVRNCGIVTLDLAENDADVDASDPLAKNLAFLTSLSHLDLSFNALTVRRGGIGEAHPEGVSLVCGALCKSACSSTLRFLNLKGNGSDHDCKADLVRWVLSLTAFTQRAHLVKWA